MDIHTVEKKTFCLMLIILFTGCTQEEAPCHPPISGLNDFTIENLTLTTDGEMTMLLTTKLGQYIIVDNVTARIDGGSQCTRIGHEPIRLHTKDNNAYLRCIPTQKLFLNNCTNGSISIHYTENKIKKVRTGRLRTVIQEG